METKNIIDSHNRLIDNIIETQKLKNLENLNEFYRYKEGRLLTLKDALAKKYNVTMFFIEEIQKCSYQIQYFTGLLFLYLPFINNPLKDKDQANSLPFYPNNQNLYGKVYFMYIDVAFQTTYMYWDRIGDLIALFFPGKIDQKRIYFSTALKLIPNNFHSSENYIWLNKFHDDEYSILNNKRKNVVHNSTSEIEYEYVQREFGLINEETMKSIQSKIESYPNFFKEQINLTFEGLEKTLLLLKEITDSPDFEIDESDNAN